MKFYNFHDNFTCFIYIGLLDIKMAKRSDFPCEYDWLEWTGQVGDFDYRATEIIRTINENEVKSEIQVFLKELNHD